MGNAVWGEYMPGAECPLSFVRYEQMAASFEMEKKEEEDLRRLQTMYPQEAKQLLPFIEDVCDRMEYNGSTMFDEHPDLETIYRLQDEIISQVSRQTEEKTEIETGEGTETGTKTEAGPGYPEALVRVLLLQEMHRRRSRRRVIRRQS